MKRIAAALVPETSEIVIDDVANSATFSPTEIVSEETDPFKEPVSKFLSKQSKKTKNKFYQIKKQYNTGVDGTKSKYVDPELVDGYGLFDLVEPPYNLDTLASLFDENAIHNACIMARAMNTVGLGYVWEDSAKSKRRQERASRRDSEDSVLRIREEMIKEDLRLNDLFDSFNQSESFTESLLKIWIDVLTTGNGYLEIGRNRNSKIGYMGHIPSIHMRVRRPRDGFIQKSGAKYIFFRNYNDLDVADPINGDPSPNEVVHFSLYSPNNTYYGVPSAVAALSAIVGDKFAKEYNIDYFENKSIPRYAIILKGAKLSEKSKQEVVNYFRNEIKGNNHGTLFVPLPATLGKEVDIKFEKLEANVQEGSFDKYRKSNRDEIMVAHRVPAPKIGVYDNANLAVSRDADKTFKVQVIGPDQKIIEKKINGIVQEFSSSKVFKFAEIDIIDDDIRSRIWDRYLRTEVVTPNEVRTNLGMTPLEDGDVTLPYPTKLQKEKNDFDMKQAEESGEQLPNPSGGQQGNNNSLSGSPPKSRQDAVNAESSNPDQTEGRRERGQAQDED